MSVGAIIMWFCLAVLGASVLIVPVVVCGVAFIILRYVKASTFNDVNPDLAEMFELPNGRG